MQLPMKKMALALQTIPDITSFQSDRFTSKMWILPPPHERVIPLGEWHYEWLNNNHNLLKNDYGWDAPQFPRDKEQEARLWALAHGLVRVNYEHRNGNIVFEMNENAWNSTTRENIQWIVIQNANNISSITVSILDDLGKVVRTKSLNVNDIDNDDKGDNIPLVNAELDITQKAVLAAKLLIKAAAILEEDRDVEFGIVCASSLSRLLRMAGEPAQELLDSSKPFDKETNPYKISVKTILPFAIFTAWKTYDPHNTKRLLSKTENRKRNSELLRDLSSEKLGAYKLFGHWADTPPGVSYEQAVKENTLLPTDKEESFFVPKPKDMSVEDFEAIVRSLALLKYNQTAYMFCDGSAVFEVTNASRERKGSKLTMPLIQQAYSELRGRPNTEFVFTGSVQPDDIGCKRIMSSLGLLWM